MKKILSILLIVAVMLQLAACAGRPEEEIKTANLGAELSKTQQLTADLSREVPQELVAMDFDAARTAADFAVSLLQNSYAGGEENLILSPYSILFALAMAANGADGETLAQMEQVLGLSSEELNTFLYLCLQKERAELSSANSIWVRHEAAPEIRPEFLQTNTNYFNAQIFRAAFDEQTVSDINEWVSQQTEERIEKMLDSLDTNTVMVLLNALSFDGQWQNPFEAQDTHDSLFYPAKGEAQEIQMMSQKVYGYLDDGKATGFVKDYKNGYSFVALLPNEGVSMEEYVASLSGSGLLQTIDGSSDEIVKIAMPKLETETTVELQSTLAAMGMDLAFSRQADFSRIDGTRELYISKVLHKTWLKIDEEGTQAAASTSVLYDAKSAPIQMEKTVILNRPFVMLIMDRENSTILFAGIVNQATNG